MSLKDIRERDAQTVARVERTLRVAPTDLSGPMSRTELDRHWLLEHVDDLMEEVSLLRRSLEAESRSRLLADGVQTEEGANHG